MNIVKIEPKDYDIPENRAKEVASLFEPMLAKMKELEEEYNAVMALPISPETCAQAKEVRLKYVKVRTQTAAIHKEAKAYFLNGGRFVDGWKNAQIASSGDYENKLKEVEEHYIRIEQEKIQKIANERIEALSLCECETIPADIGNMPDDVWNHYYSAIKKSFDDKKEAELKAEQEKIENQIKEDVYRERYLKLAKYSQYDIVSTLNRETTEDQYSSILIEAERLHSDYLKKQEETRLENERLKKEAEAREEQAAKEKQEREAREKKEREANEAKLQAEKDARESAERELQKKKEQEAMEIAAQEQAKQAELKKGDEDKIKDLINDLESIKTKYQFNAKIYVDAYANVKSNVDIILNMLKSNKE